ISRWSVISLGILIRPPGGVKQPRRAGRTPAPGRRGPALNARNAAISAAAARAGPPPPLRRRPLLWSGPSTGNGHALPWPRDTCAGCEVDESLSPVVRRFRPAPGLLGVVHPGVPPVDRRRADPGLGLPADRAHGPVLPVRERHRRREGR